jgi:glycosyltransferase involved in cell wall biosynthesis
MPSGKNDARKLRVMMIGPTGVTAMQRPVNWILAEGHQVLLVDYSNWHPDPLPSHGSFAALYPARAKGLLSARKQLPIDPLAQRVVASHLRRLAATFKPDLIHVHGITFRTHCVVKAGLQPLLVSAWGSLNLLLDPTAESLSWKALHDVLAASQALIVENPHLPAKVQALAGPALRVEMMPLGVNPDLFHPGHSARGAAWRYALKIPEQATVIFSPRGWGEVYNQHLILEAFGMANPRLPMPALLLFTSLGRSSQARSYYQRCWNRVAELGLQDSVRLAPVVSHEEMPGLYALSDLVVNYPAYDAFPSTVLEAAACQRPVISSRLLGYRDTFVEEFCTLVEANDPVALADALAVVGNTAPDTRADQLAQARAVASTRYAEEMAKNQLISLYQEVAGFGRGGLAPT